MNFYECCDLTKKSISNVLLTLCNAYVLGNRKEWPWKYRSWCQYWYISGILPTPQLPSLTCLYLVLDTRYHHALIAITWLNEDFFFCWGCISVTKRPFFCMPDTICKLTLIFFYYSPRVDFLWSFHPLRISLFLFKKKNFLFSYKLYKYKIM